MSYVRQNAPTTPCFPSGSPCFTAILVNVRCPGKAGQRFISRQSAYCARIPSAETNGLSPIAKTYSLSEQQLGQYISRLGSKVVGSANSNPTHSAILRAMGSYSSAVTVLSRGSSIRRRGAAGWCLRVLYTQYPHPKASTRRNTSSL